jgi:uncharacterized protein
VRGSSGDPRSCSVWVVGSGVLLAAAAADDRWHDQAAAILEARSPDELVVPVPVAVEAAWLIASRLGAASEATFLASLAAGDFTLAARTDIDWARYAELLDCYTDLELGLVDASVVAVTERLTITTVARIGRPAREWLGAARLAADLGRPRRVHRLVSTQYDALDGFGRPRRKWVSLTPAPWVSAPQVRPMDHA